MYIAKKDWKGMCASGWIQRDGLQAVMCPIFIAGSSRDRAGHELAGVSSSAAKAATCLAVPETTTARRRGSFTHPLRSFPSTTPTAAAPTADK